MCWHNTEKQVILSEKQIYLLNNKNHTIMHSTMKQGGKKKVNISAAK